MKKKLLSMLLPLCCLGFTAAYAQSEDPADVSSEDKEVTVSTDQPTTDGTPSLYKKGDGCGCGGKPKA